MKIVCHSLEIRGLVEPSKWMEDLCEIGAAALLRGINESSMKHCREQVPIEDSALQDKGHCTKTDSRDLCSMKDTSRQTEWRESPEATCADRCSRREETLDSLGIHLTGDR